MSLDDEMTIKELVSTCHDYAKRRGFWEDCPVDSPIIRLAKLMLIVTEISEAAEAVRHADKDNFAEELADICIRVFDLAGAYEIDLNAAIADKMVVNEKRKRMHGKLA